MRLPLAAASLTLFAAHSWAGGHFDVDDATMLDPGRCQVEAWVWRAAAVPGTVGLNQEFGR